MCCTASTPRKIKEAQRVATNNIEQHAEAENLGAWTKTTQYTGAAMYVFDATPIGVFYVAEVRDEGGHGRLLGYSVGVNFDETGKVRAGSAWTWAEIANTRTLREAIAAAAAYLA